MSDQVKDCDVVAVNRLWRAVRWFMWLGVVLGVLMLGNLAVSLVMRGHADQAETAAIKAEETAHETAKIAQGAKVSADAALDELRAAIAAIESSKASEPDLTNQAILDALQAIARIEAYTCGGPCPEP